MKKILSGLVSMTILLNCVMAGPNIVHANDASKALADSDNFNMAAPQDIEAHEGSLGDALVLDDDTTFDPQEAVETNVTAVSEPDAEPAAEQAIQPATDLEPSTVSASKDVLQTVYVSGTGSPDASGQDPEHATSDFNKALSMVAKNGFIQVVGDMSVNGTLQFPNKTVYILGDAASRPTITFNGEVHLGNWTYIYDLNLNFRSDNKDCFFVNGNRLELRNTSILGYPNIYVGSAHENVETGNFVMQNDQVEHNEINDLFLGGYDGHTVGSSSVELYNVSLNGSIYGDNTAERSYATLSGKTELSSINNVYRIFLEDRSTCYLKHGIHNAADIYVSNSKVILGKDSLVTAKYIYGSLEVGFDDQAPGTRPMFKCINMLGDVFLSNELAEQGYTAKKIKSGDKLLIDLFDASNGPTETNYAPAIIHPKEIVFWEGTSPDLRAGVSAWDYEDGDLTASILFPDTDVSALSPGQYQLVYQVQDRNGNVVESIRTAYVIKNARPIIKGAVDIEIKVGSIDTFDLRTGLVVTDDKDANLELRTEGALKKPTAGTKDAFVITYIAVDSDGYETRASRTITVTNFIPELHGLTDVVIDQGAPFDFMEGITATDYEDGTVTDIRLERELDTNMAGAHQLVYLATDSDGNTTKLTRSVTVNPVENPDPTPEVKPDPTPDVTPDPTPDPAPEVNPTPTPDVTPDTAPEAPQPPTPQMDSEATLKQESAQVPTSVQETVSKPETNSTAAQAPVTESAQTSAADTTDAPSSDAPTAESVPAEDDAVIVTDTNRSISPVVLVLAVLFVAAIFLFAVMLKKKKSRK